MNRRISLLLILVTILLIASFSCKNNPSQPPEKETDCSFPPGNRNFSWHADTVAIFPSFMGGVWAFSDSDAYVMGSIFLRDDDGNLQGYFGLHWNGTKWDKNINGTVFEINHDSRDVTGDDFYMVSVGMLGYNNPRAAIGEFDNKTKKWKSFLFETAGELYSVWTDKNGYFIAGGSNGMVYIKDGYSASWNYIKAPTDFSFFDIDGINKNEIYLLGYKNYVTGEGHRQLWKYYNENWIKLIDTEDTLSSFINFQGVSYDINDIAALRCEITDSLYLFLIGNESFRLNSYKHTTNYFTVNLKEFGLPNFSSAVDIRLFSLNDFFVGGYYFTLYHWNGFDFKKIEPLPYFSNSNQKGRIVKITKSSSGKIWILIETTSQTFQILQGEI
ncbi:MAG: hypothetical protein Q8N03_06200 [Ignavibacteria bacterium]|nr:hypothetical protein [Ignavibacteria bacterium]